MESLNPGSLAVDFPNGSEFLSTTATVSDQSSAYIISALENVQGVSDEIYLTIPENATVPYTVQQSDNAMVQYYDAFSNNEYEANSAQGSCSITVTQISPTFEGTFSAHVVCNDTVIALSNGAFNATYQ